MTSLVLALMMQYVVAAKAGLINHVQGLTNVRANQMVEQMMPIRTGPTGIVEVLLTPGSYLRLGPNSETILDSTELTNVVLRVTSGQAIIEVVEIDGDYPLKVTTGTTAVELRDAGIFRFNDGIVTVLEGKLRTVGAKPTTYKKGWEVAYDLSYRARRVPEAKLTALDFFSQKRSELLANANATLTATVRRTNYNNGGAFWLYSPMLGALTYMPMRNLRSPYGYQYSGIGIVYGNRNGNGNYDVNNSNAGSNNAPVNNSGSSSGSSGGNLNSAGERTLQTPGGGPRMTPGDYQDKKAPVVPAGPPPPM